MTCGFSDLFLNESTKRYACKKCGRAMDKNFVSILKASSPRHYKQLLKEARNP
jgi:hypothetical protein